jgi:hypothetical protein
MIADKEDTVSVDRLKPHLGTEAVLPPPAVKRGRPPLLPGIQKAAPSSTSPGSSGSGGGHCSVKKSG